MKRYYITKKGAVKEIGSKDEPFDTESFGLLNWFPRRLTACEIRDIMEENKPRIFLGK